MKQSRTLGLGLLSALFSLFSAVAAAKAKKDIYPLARAQHVYFKPDDNQREKTFEAKLPRSTLPFKRATLTFSLACPAGFCDAWDRTGSFGLVDKDGVFLELLRFMTPYGIGEKWSIDLTPFLPLLQGKQTFRVFIDTWVGPGHPQGNGWLVDAELAFTRGKMPEGRPVHVQPLLSFADIPYGDPTRPARREAELLPLIGFRSAQIITTITGHGQGNVENCAEFCPKVHELTVGETKFERRVWRDDCATTVNPNQLGTYMYARAGWCPGDKVEPWTIDVTEALLAGATHFSYEAEPFENSCRPDAPDCSGCTLGSGCAYDGGLHTEPRYYVSSYAIYRE